MWRRYLRLYYWAVHMLTVPGRQHERHGPVHVHLLRGLLRYEHGLHAHTMLTLRCRQLQGCRWQWCVRLVCSGLLHGHDRQRCLHAV